MTDDPIHRSAEPRSLHKARRCGARTRSGRPCAGGPEGRRNGNYRHGLYTKEMRARLRAMRDLTREVKDLTRKVRGSLRSGKRKADGPR
jgi:hypothetical protein